MKVIKRNGEEVEFDKKKIKEAVTRANKSVPSSNRLGSEDIVKIIDVVCEKCQTLDRVINVEEIQDYVEEELSKVNFLVSKNYITYRYTRELARRSNTTDDAIMSLIELKNQNVKEENSNKNPTIASVQRDYMAGEVSKDLSRRILLPPEVVKAHDDGLIHFHDMDYYSQKIANCCLVNLEDMLQNGTVISGNRVDRPKSFLTACTIATQISAAVASSQYGGQTMTLAHLAPFIDVSRKKIREQLEEELDGICISEGKKTEIVEKRLRREVKAGVQTIQYQVSTISSTNGQAPFITLFMYLNEAKDQHTKDDLAILIEEVLLQRIKGVKNEKGIYISPTFPKLIYVLEEDNVNPNGKYYYLTELAAKCTAKRLVPDYISEKIMLESKIDKNGDGHVYPCMGCRSFLTPYIDDKGSPKYYGRFNSGVVTINLVDVGLSAKKDLAKFWKILDDRLEICHTALAARHTRLRGTKSDIAPILWQNGALARLQKGEEIDSLLFGGYSTLSLGYAGLWETVYALIGKKLTEPEGEALGLQIMEALNAATKKWKEAERIDYSLYGTPLESTTYKFAKTLQKRFGIVEGVTDRSYITNSYHIHVAEDIDAFTKLAMESKFQKLSPGGCISYVEVPNLQSNITAVLEIIKFIYGNIMYAELNTKSDYCQVCGYDGEIRIVEEDGKLIWECPNCKNRDQSRMNVVRRTCGYLGGNFWNMGRTQEIRDRVLHI